MSHFFQRLCHLLHGLTFYASVMLCGLGLLQGRVGARRLFLRFLRFAAGVFYVGLERLHHKHQ